VHDLLDMAGKEQKKEPELCGLSTVFINSPPGWNSQPDARAAWESAAVISPV